jgi:hypothetical protein
MRTETEKKPEKAGNGELGQDTNRENIQGILVAGSNLAASCPELK